MTTDEMILQEILSFIISGLKQIHQKDLYWELNMFHQG